MSKISHKTDTFLLNYPGIVICFGVHFFMGHSVETWWILNFSQGRYTNITLREPFCTTWPDHFLKADDGPAASVDLAVWARRLSAVVTWRADAGASATRKGIKGMQKRRTLSIVGGTQVGTHLRKFREHYALLRHFDDDGPTKNFLSLYQSNVLPVSLVSSGSKFRRSVSCL